MNPPPEDKIEEEEDDSFFAPELDDNESIKIILDQARLWWGAEETNATRLANRWRLIVTIQTALLFGTVFKLPDLHGAWTTFFLGISIVLLMFSILAGLRFKITPVQWVGSVKQWFRRSFTRKAPAKEEDESEPSRPSASVGLGWPSKGFEPHSDFWNVVGDDEAFIGSRVWQTTHQSAAALNRMNGEKQATLDRSQGYLGCALLSLATALSCFIVANAFLGEETPPSQRPECYTGGRPLGVEEVGLSLPPASDRAQQETKRSADEFPDKPERIPAGAGDQGAVPTDTQSPGPQKRPGSLRSGSSASPEDAYEAQQEASPDDQGEADRPLR